jgi:DNA-directed RNA polymerase subunit RPC12/RpoP
MKPVTCSRCGALLRAIAGIHQSGEPPIHRDEAGPLIRCRLCGYANRGLSEARLAEKPPACEGA